MPFITSCQSNSYQIAGEAKGYADGDTLFLTTDLMQGTPSQIIVVKDERFELSGQTDSTFFCLIYKKNQPDINVSFFIEPGNIHIEMGQQAGTSRVSGTVVNNELQVMSDSVASIGQRMQALATSVYANEVTETEQQKADSLMQQLNEQVMQVIAGTTERNIDNELGYFILTNYQGDDVFDNQKRRELISRLPEHMRQRPVIRQMQQMLDDAANTEKGHRIPDFSLPSPTGETVSLTDEVKKNRLTIIDFWASWCGPCMQAMPHLRQLYARQHPNGLGIVGISLDHDRDAWLNAINKQGLSWVQMSDLKGWDNVVARTFQVTAIPHMVIVDQQGTILERGLRGTDLEAFVNDYLAKTQR